MCVHVCAKCRDVRRLAKPSYDVIRSFFFLYICHYIGRIFNKRRDVVRRLPDKMDHFRVVVTRFSGEQRLEIVRFGDPVYPTVDVIVAS